MDKAAYDDYRMAGQLLMENAGSAIARAVMQVAAGTACHPLRPPRVCVLAGGGNNGGDGLVAARHLLDDSAEVRVHLICNAQRVAGDAKVALDILMAASPECVVASGQQLSPELSQDLVWADIVVDALLGTGVTGAPSETMGQAISLINGCGRKVVSVDVPSGLDAATGATPGHCVKSDVTVTFGHAKVGLVLHPGVGYSGQVVVDHIGMPAPLLQSADCRMELLDPHAVAAALPARAATSHKGDFGRVLVVAGSRTMPGAAALASMACLRSGAGLVYLAAPEPVASVALGKHPEIVSVPVTQSPEGGIAASAVDDILRQAALCDCVAVGPGMGDCEHTRAVVGGLLSVSTSTPLVVDADAINALAEDLTVLKRARRPVVITPHPGELARIAGVGTAQIQQERLFWAYEAAKRTGAVVVLKGARTIVADAEGNLAVNPTGNSGMATAGSGDVLTGMVACICARNPGIFRAVSTATFCHGLAGDIAAERVGAAGMVASDIISDIPRALHMIQCDSLGLWRRMSCVPMGFFIYNRGVNSPDRYF